MQLFNIVLYVREPVVYYIKQLTVILLGIKMGVLKNLLT